MLSPLWLKKPSWLPHPSPFWAALFGYTGDTDQRNLQLWRLQWFTMEANEEKHRYLVSTTKTKQSRRVGQREQNQNWEENKTTHFHFIFFLLTSLGRITNIFKIRFLASIGQPFEADKFHERKKQIFNNLHIICKYFLQSHGLKQLRTKAVPYTGMWPTLGLEWLWLQLTLQIE